MSSSSSTVEENNTVIDQPVMVKEPSIAKFREEVVNWGLLYDSVATIEDPDFRINAELAKLVRDARKSIVDAFDEGRPFISNNYCTAPEVSKAMGLPSYMLFEAPFIPSSKEVLGDQLDHTAAMGLGPDLCTAIRSGIYYVEQGLVPLPAAMIGFIFPCDGMPMLHQVIKHNKFWKDMPLFCPDPPYFQDPRSIDYFANELKKMVSFLHNATGATLDMDKLKEIIDESNKQYLLWQEYNELRRARPSPHGYDIGGAKCFCVSQMFSVGEPDGTEWFGKLVKLAEDKVEQGLGSTPQEKIRMFWFDIMPPNWADELFPILAQEYGAVCVMDMFGNSPYTTIDTSSEESIWQGMAKRGLFDTPMVRQAIGPAEGFLDDLTRIVRDYEIDVVVWPGHMGHKESLGTYGIIREACKDLGVHFLDLRVDILDGRFVEKDETLDKFARFFKNKGLA